MTDRMNHKFVNTILGAPNLAKTALQIFENNDLTKISYENLLEQVKKIKNQLELHGVKPGLRIGIYGKSSPEWVITFLAIAACEATAVTLDPSLEQDRLKQIIDDSKISGLFVLAIDLEKIDSLPKSIPVIVIRRLGVSIEFTFPADTKFAMPSDNDPTISTIVYTSGTTGNFKGVMLDNKAIFHAVEATREIGKMSSDDNVFCILPAHHVFGLICVVLSPLYYHGTITFISELQPDVMLSALKKSNPTLFIAVPRIYEHIFGMVNKKISSRPIAKALSRFFLRLNYFLRTKLHINVGKFIFFPVHRVFGKRLKALVSGAAPLSNEFYYMIEAMGFTLLEGYGLSETTALVSANTFDDKKLGTVGMPVAGVKIKLNKIDATEDGEICIKGETLMRGYFGNPQLTNEVIDKEGWYHSGDLGRIDSQGYLTLTGRIKELIVMPNGKKVVPKLLEEHYKGIYGIAEFAIVGLPSRTGSGEEIHAVVVIDKNALAEMDIEQLKEKIKSEIVGRFHGQPEWWLVRDIHFLDSMPKTTTLKIKRHELIKMLASSAEKISPKKELLIADELQQDDLDNKFVLIIINLLKSSNIILDKLDAGTSVSLDLGMDSIGRMELKANLEREFGITINILDYQKAETLGELKNLLKTTLDKQENILINNNHSFLSDEDKKEIDANLKMILNPSQARLRKQKYARKLLNILSQSYLKINAYGFENIPKGELVMFCPNHSSHLDNISLVFASGFNFNDLVFLAAKDYFFKGVKQNILLSIFNFIPFDRSGDPHAIRTNEEYLKECLAHRKHLVLYPEGTRSLDGKLQSFKLGAAYFAEKLKLRVIPVYIQGSYECLAKGQFFPRPGNISVHFGKPMVIHADSSENFYSKYKDFTNELKTQIILLRDRAL